MKRWNSIAAMLFLLLLLVSNVFAQSEAEGTKGMVATAHPLASEAAIEMLKAGGNAVDAAVAAAFAIGVVEPDGSGIGGGGGMTIYLKEQEESYYINYYAKASEKGSESGFSGREDAHSAKAICIPGTVAGLTLAHEKFGSLPLTKILEPAITYASEGFKIDATLAKVMLDNIETLYADEATTNTFCLDGFPYAEGDKIIQKDLAETLKIIAKEGKKGFYEGALAKSLVQGISDRGGVLTIKDFSSYEAELIQPLHGTYRGYDIITANVPQSGLSLIEALNILENYKFSKAPHYSESANTLHIIAEAERMVFADRTKYLGDPAMNTIPVTGLTSKKYAKSRFKQINRSKSNSLVSNKVETGNPWKFAEEQKKEEEGGHTTHLSVIDKEGNCVSLTQTLGLFFGSGQTVNGVLFNCAMTNYSSSATSVNSYENGKQPRSTIMPTIILQNGNPFLVMGTPGAARIISTSIEIVLNIIDYDMSVAEANLSPRFYIRDRSDELYLESGIKEEVREDLTKMGYTLNVYKGIDLYFGGAQLIYVDQENGMYYGSADRRRGGNAIGY